MEILRCPAGIYQANCYIVYDNPSKEGFIIDPGGESEKLLNFIEKSYVNVKFIILTHGHFDHNGAVNTIKEKLSIPVYMNENDTYLIPNINNKHSDVFPKSDEIKIDMFIKEGDIISIGQEALEIIETPGHTPGGITVIIKGCIFTGDTLFARSIGRTDLPGGSQDTLIKSIKEKLFVLPDEIKVYPGHGPSSSIGYEKTYNPFL